MLSVEAARSAMLTRVAPLSHESVSLDEAAGRTLASAVVAARDQPPFAASAMDGYAVRRADLPLAATEGLRVAGESAAGRGYPGRLGTGEAVRIFTGAPVPEGADCVVLQEEVVREADRLCWTGSAVGDFVRPRGLDYAAGTVLLDSGRRLDGIDIALAASTGLAHLDVACRPRIALLSSGDEIVAPGSPARPHQVYDSVTYGLAALIRAWGGEPIRFPPLPDEIARLTLAAEQAQRSADLLVCIGGASVGDHDLVKPALAALGLALAVDTVAVRPGKPTWFGRTRGGPVFGLPGNPASALVCAWLFLEPVLAALQGRSSTVAAPTIKARLDAALPANGPREHYLRSRLSFADGAVHVSALEKQDSSLLSVFADADALLRRAPHARPAEPGEQVEVLRLSRG